ncbi:MAG: hypothetical protein ACPIOQ_61715, partial [Promethearchaeia archaeon]
PKVLLVRDRRAPSFGSPLAAARVVRFHKTMLSCLPLRDSCDEASARPRARLTAEAWLEQENGQSNTGLTPVLVVLPCRSLALILFLVLLGATSPL